MKPATGLVVLLVVVIALYAVSLGMGLALNGDDRGGGSSVGGGWQDALGSLTASFAPRLELGAIACNGQPVRQPFKLTESGQKCELALPRSLRHEYRKAELEFVDTPQSKELAMFVRAKYSNKQLDQQKPDRSMCLPIVPVAPGAVPELPTKVKESTFRLEIEFVPKEDTDTVWQCWLPRDPAKPFSVTVLEDGATLSLTCVGCSSDAQREMTLRMK